MIKYHLLHCGLEAWDGEQVGLAVDEEALRSSGVEMTVLLGTELMLLAGKELVLLAGVLEANSS